jgi:GxxExxY protein
VDGVDEPQMGTDYPQMGSGRERDVSADSATDEFPLKDLTEKVIGAAMEVHKQLGSGFLEKIYETALGMELAERGVTAVAQAQIPVRYKEKLVGVYLADLLVEDGLIVEIKAMRNLAPEHEAQIIHYLKATGKKVGLLLNFGRSRLQFRRFVY